MNFIGDAFTMLKPICIQVVQKPTKENTNELRELIYKAAQDFPCALQELQGYITFPLELHLKNGSTRFETRRYIVDCIKDVLHHTNMNSLNKMLNLYTLLFLQIFDKEKTGLVADVSEELKCSVLNCITVLLRRASSQVTHELYVKKNFPKLLQGIFMCVHMTHAERSRPLRLNAVLCIMTLAQVEEEDSADPTLRKQVGDMFMFILPGILAGLMKAMTIDDKQGHKVTMMALRAWSRIITLVMEDNQCNVNSDLRKNLKISLNHQLQLSQGLGLDPLARNELLQDPSITLNYLETHSRTSDWLQAAGEKLATFATNLTKMQNYPHWLVRQELVSSCNLFLTHCSRNLHLSVNQMLDILIVLSEDEVEQVSNSSKNALEMFSVKYGTESFKFLEVIEENLFIIITKIPRISYSMNDSEQFIILQLVAGYLRLLGVSKLHIVLSSASHLQRLVTTLIHLVELDASNVSLLDEHSLRDLDFTDNTGSKSPWKQFKHLTNYKMFEKAEEICALLGQFADLTSLSDHLLDTFSHNPLYRKEVVLLLNEILGNIKISDQNIHVVKNVLGFYLEPSVWYIPLSTNVDSKLPNSRIQSNLILACLLVEGIGKIASALSRSFNQFVLQTLYVVLERAGSSYGLLAQAGMSATYQVAVACGHETIAQLVCNNVDYFTYHVTMKLRRLEQNPGVIDVLNVVMKHSTLDALPCLRVIVNEVLLQRFDSFQDNHILAILRVFHTIILCISSWLRSAPSSGTTKLNKHNTVIGHNNLHSLFDVRNKLLDFQHTKQRSQEFMDTAEDRNLESNQNKSSEEILSSESVLSELNRCDKNELFVDSKGANVPGHIQITVSILTKSLHFLPSKNNKHKLVVLETLTEGVNVLANWENELLPVVHLIWSPLVHRLSDTSEPLIVNCSLNLLCTLASTAKNFIQSRTLKQVFPHLMKFIKDAAFDSKQKDLGSAYRYTHKYKLQHNLLDQLGPLCVDLGLQNKELDEVLFSIIPYLNNLQPQPLQSCCVKMLQLIAGFNTDAVWLKIDGLTNPCASLSPSEEYIIRGENISRKFQMNVKKVLQFLIYSEL